MAAALLEFLYLHIGAVYCCKSLMCNDFADLLGPCYSAHRHFTPQFRGIYQS